MHTDVSNIYSERQLVIKTKDLNLEKICVELL